jgi:signal transduction histidine kinase/CheY-like chemotaxis protein
LSGLIASSIVWDEVLENVFANEVSGIDCVLSTENQVYTYYVVDGNATFKGEGDLHDSEYDGYLREIALTADGFFSGTSATYTLRLYPSDEFFEIYTTSNPTIATIGAVCIIIFTSLLFFLYDFWVRQEFNEKKELLEAKRKFVRFVSHEVRTPLNSVCMGLALMEEEIGSALGIHSKNSSPVHLKKKLDEDHAAEWLSLATEILHNAQSSVDVLNDLLNYDKVERGSLNLELSLISIWNLIENTTTEFKLPATKKEIHFETVFDDSLCDAEEAAGGGSMSNCLVSDVRQLKAVGDNVRITQVIRNLVSNALKFTPVGGEIRSPSSCSFLRLFSHSLTSMSFSASGDVTVGVSWVKDTEEASKKKKAPEATFILKNGEEVSYARKGYIKVAVADSGAGMSEAQLAKLFRDGVQFNVNELQGGQGSGLGLYIAKGIMEQHGGTLVACSAGLGKGTTFAMMLPLYHVPAAEALPEKQIKEGYPNATSTGPLEPACLRILIVDDSPTNRKLMVRLLGNHGHICDEAEDGKIAVGMADEAMKDGKPYDSILLDYEMPVMNGPDACQKIRGLGCDAFIFGVTGNVMEDDVALFKKRGANGVLPKPFKLSELNQLFIEYDVVGRSTTGHGITEAMHSDSATSS